MWKNFSTCLWTSHPSHDCKEFFEKLECRVKNCLHILVANYFWRSANISSHSKGFQLIRSPSVNRHRITLCDAEQLFPLFELSFFCSLSVIRHSIGGGNIGTRTRGGKLNGTSVKTMSVSISASGFSATHLQSVSQNHLTFVNCKMYSWGQGTYVQLCIVGQLLRCAPFLGQSSRWSSQDRCCIQCWGCVRCLKWPFSSVLYSLVTAEIWDGEKVAHLHSPFLDRNNAAVGAGIGPIWTYESWTARLVWVSKLVISTSFVGSDVQFGMNAKFWVREGWSRFTGVFVAVTSRSGIFRRLISIVLTLLFVSEKFDSDGRGLFCRDFAAEHHQSTRGALFDAKHKHWQPRTSPCYHCACGFKSLSTSGYPKIQILPESFTGERPNVRRST